MSPSKRYDTGAINKRLRTKPCPRCYSEMQQVTVNKQKAWECPRHGVMHA